MTSETRRLIVGVDGSPHAAAALGWAAQDAELRGAELVVVSVCDGKPSRGGSATDMSAATATAEDACAAMQARLIASLPAPPPRTTTEVIYGEPVRALTGLAGPRDLLVLGTRGRGALKTLLLGSVAKGCAARAAGPVVVVPSGTTSPTHPRIRGPVVAGVDATPAARRALRFAAEEAQLRSAPLLAVYVLDPAYLDESTEWSAETPRDANLLPPLESAAAQVDAIVRAETNGYSIPVEPIAGSGNVATELLRWAESATLLAVGTRGTGRIAATLLGSVSTEILQRTGCPTAVVSAGRD